MDQYLEIITLFLELHIMSDSVDDNWGYADLEGSSNTNFLQTLSLLKEKLKVYGFENLIKTSINGLDADESLIADFQAQENAVTSWTLHFNKTPLILKLDDDGYNLNFFIDIESCERWLNGINPLLKSCPINYYNKLRVLVNGLKSSFGGRTVVFQPITEASILDCSGITSILPNWTTLTESVHFITLEEIYIKPQSFVIKGDSNTTIESIFISKAVTALSICLISEFYNEDKVVVDGIKRTTLKINDNYQASASFYNTLVELIEWIYTDRFTVRKKLFNERLTLDIVEGETLVFAISKNIVSAFAQAKERYNFVIIDRKDEYVKELKDLLKDIRNQSDLYALKIRTLLSNFLRDLLAAIVLIGFTIFTKFTDNTNLANNNLLQFVFYGLAVYYLISIVLQMLIDVTDIRVSKNEILYWKNATKELLPEKEFEEHIKLSLKGRRMSLYLLYPLIVVGYLSISYSCYKYPDLFSKILNVQQKSTIKH